MSEIIENLEFIKVPTMVEGGTEQDEFIISKNALEVIEHIKSENEIPTDFNLRISTTSGGCCSGTGYALGFDSEVSENDVLLTAGNLKMVVDNYSLFYIQGVTLDYVDGPAGSGFVFNNPNSSHSCGCGDSSDSCGDSSCGCGDSSCGC
jgi:iron-sulfur cluster assembly protein